jgi:hypothetical protein
MGEKEMNNGTGFWWGNMKERNYFKNQGTDGSKKLKTWLWSPPPHFVTPAICPLPISPCFLELYRI